MNPVVSVIIPSYNTATLIKRAIESALAQTLSAIEVIVVDDASSDNSAAIARGFADERVRVFELPENQGAGAARNRAIEAARGKWVAVLDSDDWYGPTRLQQLVEFAEAQAADIVADDLYLIREGESAPWGTLLGESRRNLPESGRIDAVTLIESETFDHGSLRLGLCKPIFLRSFLIEHEIWYDPAIKVTQDFWMLLECLIRGARFLLLPEPLYFYLARAGSLVSSSRVERLSKDSAVCAAVMARPEVTADRRLRKALENKRRLYMNLLAFNRVVTPLKAGQWGAACEALMREPRALRLLLRRLPQALIRRFQHYVLRNDAAFDMFYRKEGRRP